MTLLLSPFFRPLCSPISLRSKCRCWWCKTWKGTLMRLSPIITALLERPDEIGARTTVLFVKHVGGQSQRTINVKMMHTTSAIALDALTKQIKNLLRVFYVRRSRERRKLFIATQGNAPPQTYNPSTSSTHVIVYKRHHIVELITRHNIAHSVHDIPNSSEVSGYVYSVQRSGQTISVVPEVEQNYPRLRLTFNFNFFDRASSYSLLLLPLVFIPFHQLPPCFGQSPGVCTTLCFVTIEKECMKISKNEALE